MLRVIVAKASASPDMSRHHQDYCALGAPSRLPFKCGGVCGTVWKRVSTGVSKNVEMVACMQRFVSFLFFDDTVDRDREREGIGKVLLSGADFGGVPIPHGSMQGQG